MYKSDYTNLTIFERIGLWRKRRDLTQEKLADKAGVSRNSISMIERGEYNPTIEQLIKITKALELELIIDVREWESFEDFQKNMVSDGQR